MGLFLNVVCALAGAHFLIEEVEAPFRRSSSSFRMIPRMPTSQESPQTEGEYRQRQRTTAGGVGVFLGVAALACRWKREQLRKQDREHPRELWRRSEPRLGTRRRWAGPGRRKPAASQEVAARTGNFHFGFTAAFVNRKKVAGAGDHDDLFGLASKKGMP